MTDNITQRLATLNLELPTPSFPQANYVPYVRVGDLVFLSGQVPMQEGKILYAGPLGQAVSIEAGQAAAKLCALNLIAHLKTACEGDIDRVIQCVKLGIFVQASPDFNDHPKVANGASDLMVAVFGDKGKHARFAIGAGSLPLDAAVEVEAIFQIQA